MYVNVKDNLLIFRYADYNKNGKKTWQRFNKKVWKHRVFVMVTLAKFASCCEKVFSHKNTWIIGLNNSVERIIPANRRILQ